MLEEGVALPQTQLTRPHIQKPSGVGAIPPVKDGGGGGIVAGIQPQHPARHAWLSSPSWFSFSGLGGVYPAGLVVGEITGLFTGADGVSRYAQVKPAADLDSVRYVYVITDFGAQG